MPTLWIALSAAVLALAAAAWLRARGRHDGNAGQGASVMAAPDAGSGDDVLPADDDEAPETPGDDDDLAPALDSAMPEPERVILQRLCAHTLAGMTAVPAAGSDGARAAAAAEAAAVQTLAGIRAHPRYTPRRPHLLPQLSRAINDPDADAHSIAAILGQDPALAGNLLRIANSAIYRRQGASVEHLERAVTMLGTEGLRQIVMAALLQPVISDDGSVFARCAALLWEHTLLSADIAMRPARGARRDDLHAAQLLALLYGLGSVMVVQVLRDCWSRNGGGGPDPEALVSLLDTWSVRCARAIAAEWGLSERVQQALAELAGDSQWEALGSLGRALRISRMQAADEMLDVAEPAPATA